MDRARSGSSPLGTACEARHALRPPLGPSGVSPASPARSCDPVLPACAAKSHRLPRRRRPAELWNNQPHCFPRPGFYSKVSFAKSPSCPFSLYPARSKVTDGTGSIQGPEAAAFGSKHAGPASGWPVISRSLPGGIRRDPLAGQRKHLSSRKGASKTCGKSGFVIGWWTGSWPRGL